MEELDVLVIGGGQAGLGVGYRLQQHCVRFAVVDERQRSGDIWRSRWDSLELFTPRRFSKLPGLELPNSVPYYPGRDDMADYLERYASFHDLPVHHDFQVTALAREGNWFVASNGLSSIRSRSVILATGPFTSPHVPDCARELDENVRQMHTREYRKPGDVAPGSVLVVGGGNSAAQIAQELHASDRVVTVASNGDIEFAPKRIFGLSLFWYMHLTGMLRTAKDSKIAKYARPHSDAVIGLGLKKLIDGGAVAHVPHRVEGCSGSSVVFADGSRRDFDTIVWGTGFRPSYAWIRVDGVLGDDGEPLQDRGVSPVPGLYWIGLAWQCRLNSALVNGVSQESAEIVDRVVAQLDISPDAAP